MLHSSALFSVAWPPACGAGERTTRLSAVCCAHRATQPTRGRRRSTEEFLSRFGFNTLSVLPAMEMLEDAAPLSKDKLLAGDIPVLESEDRAGVEGGLDDDGNGNE